MGALLLLCCAAAQGSRTANSGGTAGPSDEPLAPLPPRLFYINDHAAKGCDPDNEQTLVHLLFHADLFSWEGLVGEGGTNCATRQGHLPPGRNAAEVLRVLSAYAADYPALRKGHAAAGLPGSFPSPKVLRSMVTQGVNVSAPDGLPPVATAGENASNPHHSLSPGMFLTARWEITSNAHHNRISREFSQKLLKTKQSPLQVDFQGCL